MSSTRSFSGQPPWAPSSYRLSSRWTRVIHPAAFVAAVDDGAAGFVCAWTHGEMESLHLPTDLLLMRGSYVGASLAPSDVPIGVTLWRYSGALSIRLFF